MSSFRSQEAPLYPTITPPPPPGEDFFCSIDEPFRAAQGNTVKSCESFFIAFDSCTDCTSKKDHLFFLRTMVDSMMVANFF